jgi:hypothetical protein
MARAGELPDAASRHIVTGRGPQGVPPRRDSWRGGRNETRSNGSTEPAGAWVEVEELPTQVLGARPRPRVPLTGAIAVAALVALLAGGFGLLGGSRTQPSPPLASSLADGSTVAPSPAEPPPVPRVTPWSACGGPEDEPPEPVLEVDGRPYFGQVELLDFDIGTTFDGIPPVIGQDNLDNAVDVPMDAVAEIWIGGASCAVAWNISLVGTGFPQTQILETVSNKDGDPAIAAQNRFQVFVAPYAGDHRLRAILVLENVAVRATWSVHVPPLEPPTVTLTAGDREIPTVIGCDVRQRLVNDWEEALSPCTRDVPHEADRAVGIAPGEQLNFTIEGWTATDTTVYCGQLTDRRFIPRTDPSCLIPRDPLVAGLRFLAPAEPGTWTLAISECATRIRPVGSGFEELCGTWYANVRVRE